MSYTWNSCYMSIISIEKKLENDITKLLNGRQTWRRYLNAKKKPPQSIDILPKKKKNKLDGDPNRKMDKEHDLAIHREGK